MKIRYINQVDSPPDQIGKVGDEREVSEYLGRKLVETNYAVEVNPESKGKTDGIANPRSVHSET